MYKCTECSEEYEVKPDYCKCGNDEFVEIITTVNSEKDSDFTNKINSKIEFNIKKLLPIGYILICLVLSIIPWLFNSANSPKSEPKAVEKISQDIPDIEAIWKNEESLPANNVEKDVKTVVELEKKENSQNVTGNLIKKTSQAASQKKIVQSTPQRIEQASSKNVAASTQQKSKKQSKPLQKPQNITQNIPKSVQEISNTSSQPVQKPQVISKPEPPKMNAQEFLEYKGQIRSALLSKLNITAIQGGGDCAVEFSIDNSGKLINRNFIYKSSNKSLNDEVYLMLMRLPYFKTPPANYRGEKIKLKFYINNGYYEVTFI